MTDQNPIDPTHVRQGYDRWAVTYDSMPNATVFADELTFPDVWRGIQGQRVLEIGCGTGRHTRRLVGQGNAVTALDLSPGMLAVARADASLRGVRFIESDLFQFENAAGEGYDVALASLVLEHIASLTAFFAKVASLLRPGGFGYFSEIHPSRMQAGGGARFFDAAAGREVRLGSVPHAEADFLAAIAEAGLILTAKDDVIGPERLALERADWRKYVGMPMLQIWQVRNVGAAPPLGALG